ncbi:hypothetical protein JOF55_000344 [Haloactinomyces albus]|uniref:Uncharacterized protein n=1 Tax=Haloactinomyces albus TaxID=1352928 RepID=A0AAE4CN07_9ACTN|nr:hypothetical protein [Haloactinomyces albus]
MFTEENFHRGIHQGIRRERRSGFLFSCVHSIGSEGAHVTLLSQWKSPHRIIAPQRSTAGSPAQPEARQARPAQPGAHHPGAPPGDAVDTGLLRASSPGPREVDGSPTRLPRCRHATQRKSDERTPNPALHSCAHSRRNLVHHRSSHGNSTHTVPDHGHGMRKSPHCCGRGHRWYSSCPRGALLRCRTTAGGRCGDATSSLSRIPHRGIPWTLRYPKLDRVRPLCCATRHADPAGDRFAGIREISDCGVVSSETRYSHADFGRTARRLAPALPARLHEGCSFVHPRFQVRPSSATLIQPGSRWSNAW